MPRPHRRLAELIEELDPVLQGLGYTPKLGHPLWAKHLPSGLQTIVLSFSPDDAHGGWLEPFVGLIEQRVETLLATLLETPVTHGLRHTLMVGSTRWTEPTLPRQPMHDMADVLEAANVLLRWIPVASRSLQTRFLTSEEDRRAGLTLDIELSTLDELHNTDHPLAARYLAHELHRSLRGLTIANLRRPRDLTDVLSFHRARLQDNGFWDVYGDQIVRFAADL